MAAPVRRQSRPLDDGRITLMNRKEARLRNTTDARANDEEAAARGLNDRDAKGLRARWIAISAGGVFLTFFDAQTRGRHMTSVREQLRKMCPRTSTLRTCA